MIFSLPSLLLLPPLGQCHCRLGEDGDQSLLLQN
ncbi:hypothetical protein LINPERPRIM_LOCUS28374 [Linum perenne]